jgi:competence protein ComEA
MEAILVLKMADQDHFFHFSKKERTGIWVLLSLVVLVSAASHLYEKHFTTAAPVQDSVWQHFFALKTETDSSVGAFAIMHPETGRPYKKNNTVSSELFLFDPNTLPEEGWQTLGVQQKTIETIKKYINKGGRFSDANDLEKIWGLQYDAPRLKPYVRISSMPPVARKEFRQAEKQQLVDINAADSLEWLSLPGIGPTFTKRILGFRKKLGGFYAVEQVAETYGLPDSVFQKIRSRLMVENKSLRKIDLNSATQETLKAHPYISYQIANVIIRYREQHGKFTSVQDISKIMIITDSMLHKISPYLETL